jgi:hypothetical protein
MEYLCCDASEKMVNRFIKLLKTGTPPETIRQCMIARGIDKSIIYAVLGNTVSNESELNTSIKEIKEQKEIKESFNLAFSDDTVVNSVILKFLQRSELGKKKYGVTLDRTDLQPLDWICHAQEELMDGILYLEKLKKELL